MTRSNTWNSTLELKAGVCLDRQPRRVRARAPERMTVGRIARFTVLAVMLGPGNADAGPANRHNRGQVPQVVTLTGFGSPLPGVAQNPADLRTFAAGQLDFKEIETLPQIGPLFNGVSCAGCHSQPAIGGAGLFINEIRVRHNTQPGPVHIFAADNMLRQGAQSQGSTPTFTSGIEAEPLGCQLTVPGCAASPCQQEEAAETTFSTSLPTCDPSSADYAAGGNCVVGRAATQLFGLGLVEAVADSTFDQLAQNQPAAVRGTVKRVIENGAQRVARFGWKNDHATLRVFSADAYLNEMGITNPDAPTEVSNCPLHRQQFGITLQMSDDPEDDTEPDGRADIDRFADFMRALNAPPTLPYSPGRNGARLFSQIGCQTCHVVNLTTAPNPASFIPPTTGGVPISATLNAALANRTFHPYSDFLLHDMGALGDGIISGTAGPTMMRTAPLWGLRARSRFLHDGRAATVAEAIALHAGQGAAAAAAFRALSVSQQQQVVDFLNTI